MNEPEFKNLWRRRETVQLECPGGSVCLVRRPGPGLALRLSRLQRTLRPLIDASKTDEGEAAEGRALEAMGQEQESATLTGARETVVATVVKPKLHLDPDPDDLEQIGVDDIDPRDFWHIFRWATEGSRTVPVKIEGGEETTVEAVERFPVEQAAGAGTGSDGGDVPKPEPEPAAAA